MATMLATPNQPMAFRPKPLNSSPTSPLRVHFPSTTSLVTGMSRPLSTHEAWLLYDFEDHARHCPYCHGPYKRYKSGAALCAMGEKLAVAVSGVVYMHHGQVYERGSYRRKPMRVEIPHTYTFLFQQLRVMEEVVRQRYATATASKRTAERSRAQVHPERREKEAPRRSERVEVVMEPATSSHREDKDRRKERYREEPEYRSEKAQNNQRDHRGRRDKEYRAEERKERPRRRDTEAVEVDSRDKRYRTEARRPTWAEKNTER